jgi:hypothetical protein
MKKNMLKRKNKDEKKRGAGNQEDKEKHSLFYCSIFLFCSALLSRGPLLPKIIILFLYLMK